MFTLAKGYDTNENKPKDQFRGGRRAAFQSCISDAKAGSKGGVVIPFLFLS